MRKWYPGEGENRNGLVNISTKYATWLIGGRVTIALCVIETIGGRR